MGFGRYGGCVGCYDNIGNFHLSQAKIAQKPFIKLLNGACSSVSIHSHIPLTVKAIFVFENTFLCRRYKW